MKQDQREVLGSWQEMLVTSSQAKRMGYGAVAPDHSERSVRFRVRIVWMFCMIMVAGVGARIFYLQIFESGQKLLLSQNNHIEQVRILAKRGAILDRDKRVLAESTWDDTQQRFVRKYPLGKAAAAVLGYLTEVKGSELGCERGICYAQGMEIGREGVEKTMERELRGRDGGIVQEVDAYGLVVRERGRNESEVGGDVMLAVDLRLQTVMYEALKEVRGAAVALDMQGKIRGIVTTPTYDPLAVPQYLSDKSEAYFLNRAIGGLYPPGSTFKLVTAYTGLAAGMIDGDTRVEDTGEIKVGEYRYGNWYFDQYGRKEGEVNLVKALARSNDIYFYKVGEWLGVNRLVAGAKRFGLGEKTGIESPGELAGLVPDPLWKERKTGEAWFLGNTYHLAIGQGDLLVTPVQVARMSLAAVTGRRCKLSLLFNSQTDCQDLGLPSADISLVKEGMKEACQTGGVAYPFFNFAPYVLCKTGTAQHAGQNPSASSGPSGSDVLPHAWITVAYPGENPELILTVFVEAGGEGSAVAAPIAKRILEDYQKF